MRKKIIVALATSLLLTNGAAAAFADNGSDSDKSTTSVSIEGKRDNFKLTAEQKTEFNAERDAYKAKRKAIMAAFHTAMENAREKFKAAKEAATTDEARMAAEVTFKAEVSIAVQVKTDALKALGSKPDKPALTAEQLAAIEKYRQDIIAFKAEFKIYLEKREAIRLAYKEALKALGEGPVRPEAPDFSN